MAQLGYTILHAGILEGSDTRSRQVVVSVTHEEVTFAQAFSCARARVRRRLHVNKLPPIARSVQRGLISARYF